MASRNEGKRRRKTADDGESFFIHEGIAPSETKRLKSFIAKASIISGTGIDFFYKLRFRDLWEWLEIIPTAYKELKQ